MGSFALEVDRLLDGTPVLAVSGELDIATAPAMSDQLDVLGQDKGVVVDLTRTTLADSSAMRHLLAAARRIAGPLLLVCPPANRIVRMVVDLYGLDHAVTLLDERPVRTTS